MTLKIVDLASISTLIPQSPKNEILRDNYFSVIHSYFESGKTLIFVEGESEVGKSTLLSQFVRKNAQNTFSSFVKTLQSDFLYENVVSDLSNQINWFLTKEEIPEEKWGDITRQEFNKLIMRLTREKKKRNQHFTFVIDGLDLAKHDGLTLKKLISDLPIGEIGFHFIFSGSQESLKEYIPAAYHHAALSYPLAPLTLDEVKKYLLFNPSCKAVDIDADLLEEIRRSCNNGSPGKLDNFIRILEDSYDSPRDLLADLENHSFYELDWLSIESHSEKELLKKLIAFISLDSNEQSLNRLSGMLNETEDSLLQLVQSISFLRITEKNEIILISSAHKRSFASKLHDMSTVVLQANIEHFMADKHSEESLLKLPNYLERVKKYPEIIELISVDYLPRVIQKSRSLNAIQEKLQIAYEAAKILKKDSHRIQYAGQMSLIENIEGLHVWGSEIESRISLGDYDRAIKLAQSALLKEDQLRLFVRIAKQRAIKKLPADDTISDRISKLFQEVELSTIKADKAIEIAADLLYSDPNLAFNVIQRTSSSSKLDSVEDWVIAKLSLSALVNDDDHNSSASKIADVLNDPRLEKINQALTYLITNYSSTKFLLELNKTENELDKLGFIGLWLAENQNRGDIDVIIDYTLDILVRTSSTSFPKTSLLRDLAASLNSIDNEVLVEELVDKFEDFNEDAKRLGPTLTYFEFRANLVLALFEVNYNKSIGIWEELNKLAAAESDVLAKAECYAILCRLLEDIKPKKLGKSQLYYLESFPSALTNSIKRLIKVTAGHTTTLSQIVQVLGKGNVEYASKIALQANTSDRRDLLLYYTIVGNLMNSNISSIRIKKLEQTIFKMNSPTIKEAAVKRVFGKFRKHMSSGGEYNKDALALRPMLSLVRNTALKANLQTMYLQILHANPEENKDIIIAVLAELQESWIGLNDDEISQVEVAYFIADDIESINRKAAMTYMQEAEYLREKMWIDSINTAQLYFSTIKLCIQVYGGFLKKGSSKDPQLESLLGLIERIPSTTWKMELYSDLAYSALQKDERNQATRLIKKKIRPLWDQITDNKLRQDILEKIALLLYMDSESITIDEIMNLPVTTREKSLSLIISYLLNNETPNFGYSIREKPKKPEFSKVEASIMLLWKLDTDHEIYHQVKSISDILIDYRSYSEVQTKKAFRILKEFINEKLPNKRYIKHDGYKIICLGQIGRFTKSSNRDKAYYDRLINQCDDIDNESDKVFVFTTLAEVVLSLKSLNGHQPMAKELVDKSLNLLSGLNCNLEYINRVYDISPVLKKINPSLWKSTITEAFSISLDLSDRVDVQQRQRAMIDNIYRLDKRFAESLVGMFDKDDSRKKHARRLKSRVKVFRLRERIIDAKGNETVRNVEERQIIEVCAQLITELNSDQLVSKPTNELNWLVDFASKKPLLDVIPVYEYYFQNMIKRYENDLESEDDLTHSFEGLVSLANLISTLAQNYKSQSGSSNEISPLTINSQSAIFYPGDRDKINAFIYRWITENVKDYLKICDPYFTASDLEIIKRVLEFDRNIVIEILTSLEGRQDSNLEEEFEDYWNSISKQDPPFTNVTVVTRRDLNKSPFHDRYMLTSESGLRIGISIKNLGEGKVTEISRMDSVESDNAERNAVDTFLNKQVYHIENQRLKYNTFTL
ncbi:MAG: hypothetical protein RID25_23305 [Cyclobacteriaceae bacterium]